MKIIIDTSAKTISVEDVVNLKEMFDEIHRLLPNDLWKEYSFVNNGKIVAPVEFVPIPMFPTYPYVPYEPSIPNYPMYPTSPFYYGTTTTVLTDKDIICVIP